jgi:very-short-patch-repair endonuclease
MITQLSDLIARALAPEQEDLRDVQGRAETQYGFAVARFWTEDPDLLAQGRKAVEALWSVAESPIERILAPHLVFRTYAGIADPLPRIQLPGEPEPRGDGITISPQLQAGGVRFDFYLTARWQGRMGVAIVECDGKAFHHFPDDANRDRQLLQHGIKTFRASGAELNRQPEVTAEAIVLHLVRSVMGGRP